MRRVKNIKKIIALVVISFVGRGMALAQDMSHSAGHAHGFAFTKPGAWLANLIIWGSVGVVILTLYLTLKYIFFPGEKDPNHIKYITTDEYFKRN